MLNGVFKGGVEGKAYVFGCWSGAWGEWLEGVWAAS